MTDYLRLPLLAALTLLALAVTSPTHSQANEESPYIVAVNAPLAYFAQRLGGDAVDVRLLAPPGSDPAQWRPSVEDAVAIQGAALVLLNNAGYSPWLNTLALSNRRLVHTGEAFRDEWIELAGTVTHSHGPEGEHAHGGYAVTTWMDMRQAQLQAEAVATALAGQWPAQAARIRERLAPLLSDLEVLHAAYSSSAAALRGRQLIYSHPVFQYFERAYALPGTSLHWEPDTMPDEQQWQVLAQLASDNALFVWEAAPEDAIAARMSAMGVEAIVIDPGANTGTLDWLALQRANTKSMGAAATD